jgi:hypothetical protein
MRRVSILCLDTALETDGQSDLQMQQDVVESKFDDFRRRQQPATYGTCYHRDELFWSRLAKKAGLTRVCRSSSKDLQKLCNSS